MGRFICSNLNTHLYLRKNTFIPHQEMVREIEAMNIFLMNNICIYKMFWNTLNSNTFEDFHNHYLKKDVSFLADAFEKYISTNL